MVLKNSWSNIRSAEGDKGITSYRPLGLLTTNFSSSCNSRIILRCRTGSLSRWVPCQMLCVFPQLQEACRGWLFGSHHAVQAFIAVPSISAPTAWAAVGTNRGPPDTLQARANTTYRSVHSTPPRKVRNIHPVSRSLNLVCIKSKKLLHTTFIFSKTCCLCVHATQFKLPKLPPFHTRQKVQPELSSHIKHSEDNTSYAWEWIWQTEQLAINVVCTSYLLVSKIINKKKRRMILDGRKGWNGWKIIGSKVSNVSNRLLVLSPS